MDLLSIINTVVKASLTLLVASRKESPILKRNPVFCSLTPPQTAGNALAEFRNSLLAGMLIFLCFSCRTLVEDDFSDFPTKPVLNGLLVAGQPISVHISMTAALNDTIIALLDDALVIIRNRANEADTLISSGNGCYNSILLAQSGETYFCTVFVPNYETLYAQTTVPDSTVISNAVLTEQAYVNEENYIYSSILFTFESNPALSQFWEVRLPERDLYMMPEQDSILSGEAMPLTVFSNRLMTGRSYSMTVFTDQVRSQDDIRVELRSIDESYYRYQKQLYLYNTGLSNSLGETNNAYQLYSNVINGYGIFTSCTITTLDVQ